MRTFAAQAQDLKAPAVTIMNTAAISVTATSWVEHLPTVLTVLSIIWVTIQIVASIDKWLSAKRYARGPRGYQGDQGEKGEKGEKGDDCVSP